MQELIKIKHAHTHTQYSIDITDIKNCWELADMINTTIIFHTLSDSRLHGGRTGHLQTIGLTIRKISSDI